MNQPEPLTESARLEPSASSQCEALDACGSKMSVADAANDLLSPVDSPDRKEFAQRGSLFRLGIPLLLAAGIGLASFFHPHAQPRATTKTGNMLLQHKLRRMLIKRKHSFKSTRTGQIAEVTTIELRTSDMDRSATSRVRRSLRSANIAEANTAIQAAQQISPNPEIQIKETHPKLPANADILTAIKDGNTEFFHLHMFDCCHEDGDVVEVSVGGHVYATVPLTARRIDDIHTAAVRYDTHSDTRNPGRSRWHHDSIHVEPRRLLFAEPWMWARNITWESLCHDFTSSFSFALERIHRLPLSLRRVRCRHSLHVVRPRLRA